MLPRAARRARAVNRRSPTNTTLANTVARPPTAIPTRGLVTLLNHPMNGPPIGVVPSTAIVYTAITRPRICGSEPSCTIELFAPMNVIWPAPITRMMTNATPSVGVSATAVMANPNTRPATNSRRRVACERWATMSDPKSAPTPITTVIAPYVSALPWNVTRASSGMITGKLIASVPTTTINSRFDRNIGSRQM